MSPRHFMRDLISQQLTAAAEEIFRAFEKTIVEYEEEVERQRRLLEAVYAPAVKLRRLESPQRRVCKEEQEEVLTDCRNSGPEHQEAGSLLTGEDQDQGQDQNQDQDQDCTSLQEEQLRGQKSNTEGSTADGEEMGLVEPEPDRGHHFLFPSLPVAEIQNQKPEEHDLVTEPEPSLQDIFWKPELKFPWTELPQQQKACLEKVSQTPRLWKQEESARRFLREPEPLRPEDQVPACNIVEGQKDEIFMLIPDHEERRSIETELTVGHHALESNARTHQSFPTCDSCGRVFPTAAALKVHMAAHEAEKLYSCETCGKRFTKPWSVQLHMKTHTGEKPYSCRTCGKCFRKSWHLKVHIRTHTGERPYACAICGKRFAQTGHLQSHMRYNHVAEKPFSCEICAKRFCDGPMLNRHMLRSHTDKEACPRGMWEDVLAQNGKKLGAPFHTATTH